MFNEKENNSLRGSIYSNNSGRNAQNVFQNDDPSSGQDSPNEHPIEEEVRQEEKAQVADRIVPIQEQIIEEEKNEVDLGPAVDR